jgi:hypothetical protein
MSSLVTPDLEVMRDIVATSIKNNKRNDITGMMLYSDGNIVQAIEGKKDAINDTFSRILVDMRHVGVYVVLDQKVDRRDFETWSFGFMNIKRSAIENWDLKGDLFNASDKGMAERVRRGAALTVLKSFA